MSRAWARPGRSPRGDARARTRTRPRGRLPERSKREQGSCRQAGSGAMRRCRGPGGAPRSIRLPSGAGIRKLKPANAVHGAPRERKVRKLDSLSAATTGPTTDILRRVLRCVNGGADRDLESGVCAWIEVLRTLCTCIRDGLRARGETACSAQGGMRRAAQNRSHPTVFQSHADTSFQTFGAPDPVAARPAGVARQ